MQLLIFTTIQHSKRTQQHNIKLTPAVYSRFIESVWNSSSYVSLINSIACQIFLVFGESYLNSRVLLSRNYVNNRVFLSRNYRLIVALWKFDVLKTNMLVLRTSNFQGATIRPIVPRQTLYCLYCSPVNFLLHANSKIN